MVRGRIQRVIGLVLCLSLLAISSASFAESGEVPQFVPDPPALTASAQKRRKVVIIHVLPGLGHKRSAEIIEKELRRRDPNIDIELVNFRDIASSMTDRVFLSTYLFLFKHSPSLFTLGSRLVENQGKKAKNIESIANPFDNEKFAEYLEQQKPDVILSTFHPPTLALAQLRAQGRFRDIPVGWVHVDFHPSYFDRLVNAVEKAFVPHRVIAEELIENGADRSKIAVTGFPMESDLVKPLENPSDFLKTEGLAPSLKVGPQTPEGPTALTVVMSGGGEGIGDQPEMTKSIVAKAAGRPVQIIAFVGNSEKNLIGLTKLAGELPANVQLRIERLGPGSAERLMAFTKVADVAIAKGGGRTPPEIFLVGAAAILLGAVGGHEQEALNKFTDLKLARMNRNAAEIGEQVFGLVDDEKAKEEMMEAQDEFRRQVDMEPIVTWVLNAKPPRRPTQEIVPSEPTGFWEGCRRSLKAISGRAG